MKKSKYEEILKEFSVWKICSVTGEMIPIESYLDLYCKNDLAHIAGYDLNEDSLKEVYEFILSEYPSFSEKKIKKIIKKLPAIAVVFYIYLKYDYLNLDLFDLVFKFHISQENDERITAGLNFIHMYVYLCINRLIKEKYIISIEPSEENDYMKFVVKNNKYIYTFKNLSSIIKIKDMIMNNELGNL